MWTLLVVLAQVAATTPPAQQQSSEAAKKALSTAAGKALQGNAAEAIAVLQAVSDAEFGAKDKAIRNCIIDRFGSSSKAPRPANNAAFADRAIESYRNYWRSALTRPETRPAEEERLATTLRALLQLPVQANWDEIEKSLATKLKAEGYYSLMGRTPPLLELIVWRSEVADSRNVALPEQQERITVKLLDDFASLGWSAYATCDRSFTGGWVKPDAIYAVRPGWKSITDENFLVSFVSHETQHFADKARFGELESWELEYRGKLAELALAKDTLPRLLTAFDSNQGIDPAVPHSYANALVLSRLREWLGISPSDDIAAVGDEGINRAARALLVEDSARRLRD